MFWISFQAISSEWEAEEIESSAKELVWLWQNTKMAVPKDTWGSKGHLIRMFKSEDSETRETTAHGACDSSALFIF